MVTNCKYIEPTHLLCSYTQVRFWQISEQPLNRFQKIFFEYNIVELKSNFGFLTTDTNNPSLIGKKHSWTMELKCSCWSPWGHLQVLWIKEIRRKLRETSGMKKYHANEVAATKYSYLHVKKTLSFYGNLDEKL